MNELSRSVTRRNVLALLGAASLTSGLVLARAAQPPPLPEVRDSDLPAGYRAVDSGMASSVLRSVQASRHARVRRYRWAKGAVTLVVEMVAFPTSEGLQAYLRDDKNATAAWHLQSADGPIRAHRISGWEHKPLAVVARIALRRVCIFVMSATRGRPGDGLADPGLVARLTTTLRDRAKRSGD